MSRFGDVECVFHGSKVYVADGYCAKEENDFETFEVFHFHAVEIGFVQGQFAERLEDGYGDIGLFAFGLGFRNCSRLPGQETGQVFRQFAVLAPGEAQFGGGISRGRVGVGAIEGRCRGLSEAVLGHLEGPCRRAVPGFGLEVHRHLLIGVVEVDGEAGWKDGFWRGRNAAILADGLRREARLSPFRDDQDLAEEDVGDVGVVEGGGIAVVRGGGGRIRVAEGVDRFRVVSVLTEIDAPKLGLLVVLEVEGCLG